ncbi:hypothetical protein RHGRI_034253 [Rhododendron griersonianum]|uniref:Uncharacterized protein n=1 Tax=Rhododendron griersonianum TaxID=479676 RepID=A0AAV6I5M5_9ERIC|nr:hypothetical protein RHGRI_034253 [Rhododendron griersonianum]
MIFVRSFTTPAGTRTFHFCLLFLGFSRVLVASSYPLKSSSTAELSMDDDARPESHNHRQTPTKATSLHAAANNNGRSRRCGELEEEDNFAEERGGGAVVWGSVPYVFCMFALGFSALRSTVMGQVEIVKRREELRWPPTDLGLGILIVDLIQPNLAPRCSTLHGLLVLFFTMAFEKSKFFKFLGFMWNPLSWVMETTAIMAIVLANDRGKHPDWQDFVGIITLHVINSTISFIKENNAGNNAAALMACLAPKAKASHPAAHQGLLLFNVSVDMFNRKYFGD